MGGSQSSERGGAEAEVKTSYYELLGVSRQAKEEELKKAYRRKALELHPDRNYGNEENATKTFAEVQAAYEVLSDPQERAWYDSHESAILRGDDGQGSDDAPSYQNVRITTADDLARLVRKFNSKVDFTDSPSGFYGFVRSTFEQLAMEESIAAAWENQPEPEYPTFGHKDDEYDPVVKSFYAVWSSFSTVKSFAWRDKYRMSEAPDRWVRRRMEQENKAFRKEGVKEFNDAVRALVAFIRKRDPRHTPSTQSEAERQNALREAAAAQARRAREANQAKMDQAIPEWAQSKPPEPEEGSFEEEEDEEQEVFECVACNKVFKSENQWEAHEKSKKHQKAVYALKKSMRKQNAHLDLDDDVSSTQPSSGVATPDVQEDEGEDGVEDEVAAEANHDEVRENRHANVSGDSEDETLVDEEEEPNSKKDFEPKEDEASDEDSDYASRSEVEARLASATLSDPADEEASQTTTKVEDAEGLEDVDNDEETAGPSQPKMGKAAQKRAKKAAAAAASEAPTSTHTCATCNASFPSRTQLFQHITKNKHAAVKNVPAGAVGGKKKGKGKK